MCVVQLPKFHMCVSSYQLSNFDMYFNVRSLQTLICTLMCVVYKTLICSLMCVVYQTLIIVQTLICTLMCVVYKTSIFFQYTLSF